MAVNENQQSLRVWLARPLIVGLALGYIRLLPTFDPPEVVYLLGVMCAVPPAINPLNRGAWLWALLAAATLALVAFSVRMTFSG